jgi:glycosyltransferase involved in cell wall biosynthesis
VLDHVANLVDEVIVYDDCSTDWTADICEDHPIVGKVIRGKNWSSEPELRAAAEGTLRQLAYLEAVSRGADWIYCFDGDEYLELNGASPVRPMLRSLIDTGLADSFSFRLFDFYITPEDVDSHWLRRRWIGPEYRDIMMVFRVAPSIVFFNREPSGVSGRNVVAGWVRHYGKAISPRHWEETCDYYVNHRGGTLLPEFTEKWKRRRGKAIHNGVSDFGNRLIQWAERDERGIPLKDDPMQYRQA